MNFSITITDVNMDGLPIKFANFLRAIVSKNEMRNINVSFDAGMVAFTDEARHFIDAV